MTPAERKQKARDRKARWKARRDAGRVLVTIEIGENVIDTLCVLGWIDACESYRRKPVQDAVQRFLDAVPAVTRSRAE